MAKLQLPLHVFALRAFFICTLIALMLPKSVGINDAFARSDLRKMVLGSRPPGCVNKCMNCRPCEATLVIPPHKNTREQQVQVQVQVESSSHREDDSYYLLTWKCRCGNNLYPP